MRHRRQLPSSLVPLVIAFAAMMTLAACSGPAEMRDQSPLRARPAGAGVSMQDPARIYRVGPGDKIKLTVFNEPDLSGPFELTTQGTLTLPLIGDIPARGRTVSELTAEISNRLSQGYLRNPKVSVEILNYRPIYVHGEVRSGGEFPFKQGLTLRDAVAKAGGYTYRATTSHVLITRDGMGTELRIDLPSDAAVLPGDNIRVPERFF